MVIVMFAPVIALIALLVGLVILLAEGWRTDFSQDA